MHKSLKRFRHIAAVAGASWIAAFAITGPSERHVDPMNPVAGLWSPPVNYDNTFEVQNPVFQSLPGEMSFVPPLCRAMRAAHFQSDGGSLKCGRAVLEVPEGAVKDDAYFLVEDVSQSAPAFEIEYTADCLAHAMTLRISYRATHYSCGELDPLDLDIYRETAAGRYQRMPSSLDRVAQCVFVETKEKGRYVLG